MFETQIDNGIRFLDSTHGIGWEHKIDVDTLNIADGCGCVCGQLYSAEAIELDYVSGYEYWVLTSDVSGDGKEFGFLASWGPNEPWEPVFAQLTDEWRDAIIKLCAANRVEIAA